MPQVENIGEQMEVPGEFDNHPFQGAASAINFIKAGDAIIKQSIHSGKPVCSVPSNKTF